MDRSLLSETAANLGIDEEVVGPIVDEFLLQLHRRAFEYEGANGDLIGEQLHYDMGRQAFYHLLGFLDWFTAGYGWSERSASEYLHRIGPLSDWIPFRHQMDGWLPGRLTRLASEPSAGSDS